MSGGLIGSVVVPHTPRMGVEENAPDFVRGLIGGLRETGEALRALKPDLVLLHSAHWVTTFNWYVSAHEVHEGVCVAEEAPDLIPGMPYRYSGDPAFAQALAGYLNEKNVPCSQNTSPHYNWDYGTWVPMHYMDPQATLPVVTLSTVVCSELKECLQMGEMVYQVAQAQGKRVVYISSCALSHDVLRGPALMPTPERQALDQKFIRHITEGSYAELIDWAETFSKDAVAEMGGRTICGMLGALQTMTRQSAPLIGKAFGTYGQSSGSGNISLAVFSS